MELQEFVRETLSHIIHGIDEASGLTGHHIKIHGAKGKKIIEFDVAVSAFERRELTGKAGVKVWEAMSAGGGRTKETKNERISRIKFTVEVAEPKKRKR
jgi:hypothetical protein